ncbi:MAG: FAD-dependent thymidylate synthase [Firmicutes bacterium]|nr:FAD-dependent thymidylate synthase [Bacillota bacterium]
MKISVVAGTKLGKTPKEEFDDLGGKAAGICYMASTFEEICTEPKEKTIKRTALTKSMGHHSVYDHCNITLYLHEIPRVIEVLLDNERMMTSSVKSGRYTQHVLKPDETIIYEKWLNIFQDLIAKKYKYVAPKFFSDSRILKLAQENARYLTSSFTLVSMAHTMSYRQLNYVYGFIRDFIKNSATTKNKFILKLLPYLKEFLKQLDDTGYIDNQLVANGKNRELSLFNNYKASEYFGDVYCTSYKVSFAVFLHLNRHRTLKHYIAEPNDNFDFYTPELIADDAEYSKQWYDDLTKLKSNYPQAMLIDVTEMGNIDDFILKVIERKCSCVMLETQRNVTDVLNRYYQQLEKSNHPRAKDLKGYLKGARCTFPNYKCDFPCQFADAITEKRKV